MLLHAPLVAAMYVIVSVSVLVFPIVFLVPLQPSVSDLISGMAFAIAVLGSMCSLFVPKALLLWQGADLDAQFRIVMPTKAGNDSFDKYDATFNLHHSLHAEDQFPDAEAIRSVQNSKIPRDQKKDICREQIEKWQILLMKLENKNILDDSSGGLMSSSHPTRSSAHNLSSVALKSSVVGLEYKLHDTIMQKGGESFDEFDGSVIGSAAPKKRVASLERWSEKESSNGIPESVPNILPMLSVRASDNL